MKVCGGSRDIAAGPLVYHTQLVHCTICPVCSHVRFDQGMTSHCPHATDISRSTDHLMAVTDIFIH